MGIDVRDPATIPAQLANVAVTGMFPNPEGGDNPGIGGYAVGYLSRRFRRWTARPSKHSSRTRRIFLSELASSGDLSANSKTRVAFRDPDGPWRHDPIYLFVMDPTGYTIFHGAFPDRFELNTPTTTPTAPRYPR